MGAKRERPDDFSQARPHRLTGKRIVSFQSRNPFGGGTRGADGPDALAGAPDVPPRLALRSFAGDVDFVRVPPDNVLGVQSIGADRRREKRRARAGERLGDDDIRGAAIDDHLFERRRRVRFRRSEKRRADIGEVCAEHFRCENRAAGGDRPGQRQRATPPRADLLRERERRNGARVSAGPGRDGDDAVDAHFGAFAGVAVAGDVVEDKAAVTVDGGDDLGIGAQRQHHDGNAAPDDDGEIVAQTGVGAMADKIDRVRDGAVLQIALDLGEIVVEQPRSCAR